MEPTETARRAALLAATLAGFCLAGCSRESRQDIIDAADGLNNPDATPQVVRDQQRKERRRQNSEWTTENQALHPIEYCEAQLDGLKAKQDGLAASALAITKQKSETDRKLATAKSDKEKLDKVLAKLKAAYRENGAWPRTIGDKPYTESAAREAILETAARVGKLAGEIDRLNGLSTELGKRHDQILGYQRSVGALKAKLETTKEALKTKQVVDDANAVKDALAAINDSLDALGDGLQSEKDPLQIFVEDVEKEERAAAFDAIMAEP